jgi:hypothetical protein
MNKTFINSASKIWVNSIALPDDWTGADGEWQLPEGHEFVDGNGGEGYVWNGSSFDAPAPPPPPPEPTWQEIRISAYGSWGDQLDMQYWDGVNDTTIWVDHVAAVKLANPKP